MSNYITVVGNLTRDPELRYTSSGRGVASFGLAVSRRFKRGDDWEEQTSFFNVVCWGDLGENIAASLTKGSRAIVTGRLEQRSYDDQDGNKRSIVEIVADEVGPSLRWATATIERTEREQGGRQSAQRQADPIYGDEEPF